MCKGRLKRLKRLRQPFGSVAVVRIDWFYRLFDVRNCEEELISTDYIVY